MAYFPLRKQLFASNQRIGIALAAACAGAVAASALPTSSGAARALRSAGRVPLDAIDDVQNRFDAWRDGRKKEARRQYLREHTSAARIVQPAMQSSCGP